VTPSSGPLVPVPPGTVRPVGERGGSAGRARSATVIVALAVLAAGCGAPDGAVAARPVPGPTTTTRPAPATPLVPALDGGLAGVDGVLGEWTAQWRGAISVARADSRSIVQTWDGAFDLRARLARMDITELSAAPVVVQRLVYDGRRGLVFAQHPGFGAPPDRPWVRLSSDQMVERGLAPVPTFDRTFPPSNLLLLLSHATAADVVDADHYSVSVPTALVLRTFVWGVLDDLVRRGAEFDDIEAAMPLSVRGTVTTDANGLVVDGRLDVTEVGNVLAETDPSDGVEPLEVLFYDEKLFDLGRPAGIAVPYSAEVVDVSEVPGG
jgi:hypothetical protein